MFERDHGFRMAWHHSFGYTGFMWDLAFSVMCSAAIAFLLKVSERQGRDRLTVIAANYLVAIGLSGVMAWHAGGFHLPAMAVLKAGLLSGWPPHQPPDPWHSLIWAGVVGVPGGLAYFYGFVVMLRSIRESGVALTGAAAKMAVVVPLVTAVLLWRERPGWVQWTGIALALGAILLAQLGPDAFRRSGRFRPVLLVLFMVIGLGELANKAFEQYAVPRHNAVFLLVVFTTAQVVAIAYLLKQRRRPVMGDVMLGLVVGVPNMLTSWFLIRSFATVPAAIAYPVYSAGTIVLVALGGRFLFQERLRRREWAAIGLAVLAVILMNRG